MGRPVDRSEQRGMSVISFLVMRRRPPTPEKTPPSTSSDERKMAMVISRLLRVGVLLSAAIVLLGGIVYLGRHGEAFPLYHVFNGEPQQLRSLQGIVSAALSFSGRGIIQLGLLVLLATPMARVAVSFVGFLLVYDRLYTVVTGLVLAILILGFFNLPV